MHISHCCLLWEHSYFKRGMLYKFCLLNQIFHMVTYFRCSEVSRTEMEKQSVEVDQADRSIFVQELLLSSLAEGLRLDRDSVPLSGSPPNVGTADSVENSDGSDCDRPVSEGRKTEAPHVKTSSQGKPRLSKPVTNHKKVEREPPPPTHH